MPLYERTINTILRGRAGVKTHAHKYNKSEPLMFFNTKISQKVLVIEKTAVILSADNKTDWADSQQLNNKSNMKQITLKSGRKINVLPRNEINRFEGYENAVAVAQIRNCGFILTDSQYNDVIDCEYDLAECYCIVRSMISNRELTLK